MYKWAAIGTAILVALAVALTVFSYRARKLAILEPYPLETRLAWSGASDAPCTLLMVGDSHVARWRTPPPSRWRVARAGFPGEAAGNIAAAMPAAVRASAPDAVLIAAGTNDASAAALLWEGSSDQLDRSAAALERMVAVAHDGGARQVLVMTLVPPRSPQLWRRLIYGERQAGALTGLSQRIVAAAAKSGAEVLDANALARDAKGAFRPELRADALHWSPAGYEVLSAALWERLNDCR